MVRRAFSLLAATLALAGCAQVIVPGRAPSAAGIRSLAMPPSPGHPAPVALLAPLTGVNAERGQALVQAAQLALAAPGSPPLDVRDTGWHAGRRGGGGAGGDRRRRRR